MLYEITIDPMNEKDVFAEHIIDADSLVTAVTAAQRIAGLNGVPADTDFHVSEWTPASYGWLEEPGGHTVRGAMSFTVYEGIIRAWGTWADAADLRGWAEASVNYYRDLDPADRW